MMEPVLFVSSYRYDNANASNPAHAARYSAHVAVPDVCILSPVSGCPEEENGMKWLISVALAASLLLSAPAQQHQTTLLFRNVDVFDGSRMIRHTSVLVRDGMIRA